MNKLAWIGFGGVVGTLCRYFISAWIDERSHSTFPYGTLAVNLSGCFIAGLLFPILERLSVLPELRLAIFTGFLGGFTTFSAYGLQTIVLANNAMFSIAALNVVVSNVGGLFLVWFGYGVARAMGN